MQPISAKVLFQYLFTRKKLRRKVAKKYGRQVHYELGDRQYYALGFGTDFGGYELPNSFQKSLVFRRRSLQLIQALKTCLCLKASLILSYKTPLLPTGEEPEAYVILNSISLFERARPFIVQHSQINLYLDRDSQGRPCRSEATLVNEKYKDASGLYECFKDLNEWLVSSF
ncbi:MAG: hypothetical protein ABIN80_14345 [Dyadobacter sp.]|uniref:hypothetical protein n=1 Tax=Dyadobacter sp. TaxID=1914288 RepID=UPI0032640F7D